MAERDKVIKSGQLTIPRLLFLAVVGGLIVAMVSLGGKALIIGYWGLTLAICGLLYLIAIDWRVKMDRVDLSGQSPQAAPLPDATSPTTELKTTMGGPRPKRRPSRSAKRRR